MIANAEQAVERLRHARTGEILPTKNIDRNTKLVYYADELVGLKLHQTVIALYKPNGVVIDVRGDHSPNSQGWFTQVTWQRIDAHTPARTFQHGGLRYLSPPGSNWDRDAAHLYAHGVLVFPDGGFELPLEPFIESEIRRVIRTFPRKLKRHAKRVIEGWKDWQQPDTCCVHAEDPMQHYLTHIERSEPLMPSQMPEWTRDMRNHGLYGTKLIEELRRVWLEPYFDQFTQLAVKTLAPEFPYPQVTRR